MKTRPHQLLGSGLFTSILLLLFLGSSNDTYSQVVSGQPISSTTTWTVPPGVTSVTVECWGAGGAGGSGNRNNLGSGGGGGGAYSMAVLVVIPENNYTVNVGAGGLIIDDASGNPGGDTWFINSTQILAKGGSGGTASSGNTPGSGGLAGLASSGIGTTKHSGGSGGNGNNNTTGGGGGSSAGTFADGGDGGSPNGGTEPTGGGAGGDGGTDNDGLGLPGIAPGGGGGGEADKDDGGNGANGQVILTFTASNDKCPESTSIAPTGTQTLCQGDASSQLTATITNTTGGSGTPTHLYQWYYNTTNSNTVAGATLIGGATNQAYTPLTTVSEIGDRWYFCVGYATDNNCDQTNATESLASNAEQVTVNATPAAPTGTAGQSFCAIDNPTVNDLSATGTAIQWYVASSGGSPLAGGTALVNGIHYYATQTISGCESDTRFDVTVTVKDIPALPVITGLTTVVEGNNYDYSIDPVGDATNYTWAWPGPPGAWSLVTGQGTTSLTVTAGAQGGDITVFVTNSCGDGPTATLSVVIGVPPNCPESTSIAPTGTQTLCQGDSSNQLTATITTSGGSGTPTELFQWYYNTTNSNTVSGATLLGAATASSYTPLTSASEIGDRWYFCVGYATDNTCSQTNADQTLASNTVQITVKDVPALPVISGATTVTAGNPESYSIVPVGDATNYTWTVPGDWTGLTGQGTASITVTPQSAGDITVYVTNSCGNGPTATKSVTLGVSANCPESTNVTPSGIQTLCEGDASSQLTATITNSGGTGTPSPLYQWYYNTTNSNNPSGATLVGTSTTYTPPTSIAEDRWYFCVGYATDNGCGQSNNDQTLASNTVQITVYSLPIATAITGNSQVCIGSNITLTEGTSGTIAWNSSNTGVATINSSGLVTPVSTGTTNITYTVTDVNACTSAPSPAHAVTVIDTPVTPTISGLSSVPPFAVGYQYSIAADPTATLYSWSFPANWVITSATNSNIVTVTTGGIDDDGNITVTVTNPCDISLQGIFAVAVDPATNHTEYNCTSCHILHDAPGTGLSSVLGNALLCQSCHITNGAADAKPLVDANNIALFPSTGNSHAWDVFAENTNKETLPPLNNQMLLRVVDNQIICSTCHNQHNNGNAGNPYLRMDNTGDLMCKDCHRQRNKGLYSTDNTNNRGSHPVGITYDGADSRFNSSPSDTQLINNKVECSSCHGVHDVTGSLGLAANGNLLRTTNDENLCQDCHNYGDHRGMTCLDCHEVHNTVDGTIDNNIYMIKSTIATPDSGNKTVIFTAEGGPTGSFAGIVDGSYTGICEVCHDPSYSLDHFQNDGNAPDQIHTSQPGNIPEANCTTCHPHSSDFDPTGGDCTSCHQDEFPTWNVSDGHVAHTTKYNFACSTCHFERGSGTAFHEDGTADINFNSNGLARRNGQDSNTPVFNGDNTCSNIYCHSNGMTAERGTDVNDAVVNNHDWADGSTTPTIPFTNHDPLTYATTPNWYTGSITACNSCHGGPGALPTGPSYDVAPATAQEVKASTAEYPQTGGHGSFVAQHLSNGNITGWVAVQCFWCHDVDSRLGTDLVKKQGTYGTSFHVDGETYFKVGNIGVDVDGTFETTLSRGNIGSHCNTRSCWGTN